MYWHTHTSGLAATKYFQQTLSWTNNQYKTSKKLSLPEKGTLALIEKELVIEDSCFP
jgi:hypothetical protein